MSNYPSYASYFLREFSGISTATFRVPPQSSGTLSAGRQMIFNLPTNTLVSMKDVRLVFTASTSTSDGSGCPRLPKVSSLVERIVVNMGGIQVDSGCSNQNVLQQALDNMKREVSDPVDSHSEMYRLTSGVNLKDFGANAEIYTTTNNATQFAISLGSFFQTVQPNMLDMSLLPEVQVIVYLTDDTIICSPTDASSTNKITAVSSSQATFTVENYQLLVPCYSIDDGAYSKVVQSRMNDEGYLEATFCGYDSYSDTFTAVTRVASAASSLDKIIAVWRRGTGASPLGSSATNGYLGINPAIPIAGTNVELSSGLSTDNVLDQADCRGGKYLPAPMTFTAPMTALPSTDSDAEEPELAMSINSVRYPQFNCRLSQWYQLTKDAFEVNKTLSKSYIEYLTNRFMIATRLNLPQSSALRVKSGLDLRGSNSSILISAVNANNLTTNDNVIVFLESTRVLRIGVGKTLQVIL